MAERGSEMMIPVKPQFEEENTETSQIIEEFVNDEKCFL
jgi:antitoxin component of RelBE/YafQ-DinJ toxin-antitoxin module